MFGGVGTEASLIDKIVDFEQAAACYDSFDKNKVGKVIFDPWQ